MARNQLEMLIPKAALEARDELTRALRAADNPAAWMIFMTTVTRLLPEVLSTGRPTKEAIERCAIGQLGFKSWQAMIEAPAENNGLAWNFSGWKAWRRAWTAVQANPWLLKQAMTASEVNTISLEAKRTESEFPKSLEDLTAMRVAAKGEIEQSKANTVAALAEQIKSLEKAGSENVILIATLREQLAEALNKIQKMAEEIGTLKATKTLAETAFEKLKAQQATPPTPVPQAPKLTRWQHLIAAIFNK